MQENFIPMKRKSLLLLVLILNSFLAFAQKDYAISSKGDTLVGELKLFSYDNLDRLQINSEGKKTTYTLLQIRSFVKEKINYIPVRHENSLRFMRVIKEGYLSLLAFKSTPQSNWDDRYLLKKDDSGMEVPNLSFKKILAKYLEDCPEVHDQIERGDFSRGDIEKIIDLYNLCIQSKTEALIKTKAPTISFNSDKMLALMNLSEKVEAENFLTKKDVTDLLNDIKAKIAKNEVVPNYLTEGLKSYLSDTPTLLKEAESFIELLKK